MSTSIMLGWKYYLDKNFHVYKLTTLENFWKFQKKIVFHSEWNNVLKQFSFQVKILHKINISCIRRCCWIWKLIFVAFSQWWTRIFRIKMKNSLHKKNCFSMTYERHVFLLLLWRGLRASNGSFFTKLTTHSKTVILFCKMQHRNNALLSWINA